MENVGQITLNEPKELSEKQRQCWRVLTKELAKCALHSRQEIGRADYLVYFESLGSKDPESLRAAIVKCREKLDYIPKIHEIENEYEPPAPKAVDMKIYGNLLREYTEPWSETADILFSEYEHGRAVKFIKRAKGAA